MNLLPILLALVAASAWGISNAMMKVPSALVGPAKAILIRQGVMTVLLIFPFIFSYNPADLKWLIMSFLLGIYGYIPFYLFCEAMTLSSVGIVSAIGNAYPFIVSLLSYLLLDVILTPLQWLGIILTTLGVFILTLSRVDRVRKNKVMDRKHSLRAMVLSLIACFLWGIFFTAVLQPSSHLGVLKFVFCAQFGTLVVALFHSRYLTFHRNIGKKSLKIGFRASLIALTGSLAYYKALLIGNPSVVTGISGCQPIVGAIFGIYYFKERFTISHWLGVILSVIGVALLK